jgi:hypothetical protein
MSRDPLPRRPEPSGCLAWGQALSRLGDVPPVGLIARLESEQPGCSEGLVVAGAPVDKIGRQRTGGDGLIAERDRCRRAHTQTGEAGLERKQRCRSGTGRRRRCG